MFRVLLVLFSFFLVFSANSQIVNEDGETVKKEKEKKVKKEKCDTCDYSLFYLNGTIQRSFRSFEDNSVYNYYSDWELQTPDYNFGVNGGLLMPLSQNFELEIGASYFGHGENFSYEDPDSDSLFMFTNRYMQLAVPIKIKYVFGDDIKFYGGIGIMPSNVLNIRYNETYQRVGSAVPVVKDPVKINNDFSAFNVYALGTIGVQYHLEYIGFNLGIDYRHGLTNTFANTTQMIVHKMNAFVLNYGIIVKI